MLGEKGTSLCFFILHIWRLAIVNYSNRIFLVDVPALAIPLVDCFLGLSRLAHDRLLFADRQFYELLPLAFGSLDTGHW